MSKECEASGMKFKPTNNEDYNRSFVCHLCGRRFNQFACTMGGETAIPLHNDLRKDERKL